MHRQPSVIAFAAPLVKKAVVDLLSPALHPAIAARRHPTIDGIGAVAARRAAKS